MNKKLLIDNLLVHFNIRELVCPHVHEIYGDESWMFLDEKILHTLLVLRNDIIKMPMTINNYHIRGPFTQRGLRCPFCQLVKDKVTANQLYLSPHTMGQAYDFDVLTIKADRARQFIYMHSEELPYPIRMELNINWVHIDTFNNSKGVRIYTY
jgi:hypothetical protein